MHTHTRQRLIPDSQRTLVISPCSSHAPAQLERGALCGARRSRNSRAWHAGDPRRRTQRHRKRHGRGDRARRCQKKVVNQIGQDTLPQLLALLGRASVFVGPDSGPAHMATMVGTPVIGLYAATRCARSGPYLSQRWCVDRYAEAARRFAGASPKSCRGRTRSRSPASWTSFPSTPSPPNSMSC